MSDTGFVHLHVHSQYSLLDGCATIKGLVEKAKANGQKGIALTDHGNMYGIKELFNYCDKINSHLEEGEEPFKPIFGCEMYVARDSKLDKKDRSDNGFHLIVLAKNLTGYHNLVKLVSRAWTDGFYYHPRTDHADLEKYHEGLIVCSACLGGEVPQLIMGDDLEEAEKRILWYKNLFGDDYYLEMQRHETFKQNANTDVFPEQQRVNKVLVQMARKHGIKLIATNDVHFVNEEDGEAHDRLICISTKKKFFEPRMHYTKQEWLKSTEEMASIFSDLPEALANTVEILDKVETYNIDHEPIMPTFEIPQEFGTEEEYRLRITEKDLFDEFTQDENGNVVLSQEEAEKKIKRLGGYDKLYRIKFEADYLAKLTFEGAKKRYGDPLPPDVLERIKFELHIMKTMGFPGYFLIVQDFINTGRDQLGVSIGPGRGSAAGSAAAYCLGITQVDPIKYDLLFERFLNPDRISLPDIDVDFDDDGRYEVLKYVTQKYGAEKVAHIITYGTMATKMAIKDMASVMGLPPSEANRLAKLVPGRLPDGSTNISFKACEKQVPEFRAECESPDQTVREVMKYAGALEGNVRGTGIHACGVIICRDDITDWVPVSTVTDPSGERVLVTEYEGSVIEQTGLIKMDFLGLKTLSIIKEALENIKNARGIEVDIDNIPLDDKATYDLYCKGNTTATFQFESPGMQQSLRELQPSKFEDLIAMNALYRPGPMDYIPDFIARKHGVKPIEYDIPIMEQYLHETYGITVYQEQVMLLSRLLANFTRGESDMLRKAMGKKLKDKMAALKVKFISGGKANGHKEDTLEKIWADWEKFASYAFNKSHATCYSWVAYQTAYLKAHYPAEYMAGVLSRNLAASDKLSKFMSECQRMGIKVLGPDINQSVNKFGVTKSGDIRFGLGAIKGMGSNTIDAILEEREAHGPFKDLYDLVERVNLGSVSKSSITNLAFAGAFDSFEGVKREMFATDENTGISFAEALVHYGQRYQNDKNSLQASLFDDEIEMETDRPEAPRNLPPMPLYELLAKEKELLTIYISAHPLDPYYLELKYGCNMACTEVEETRPTGSKALIGGMITSVQRRTSKKGNPFVTIEIEDFTGKGRLNIFDQASERYAHLLREGQEVLIKMDFYTPRFSPDQVRSTVTEIAPLKDYKGKLATSLTICLDLHQDMAHFSKAFKELMEKKPKEERPGKLTFEFHDSSKTQSRYPMPPIKVESKKNFSLSKGVIDFLEEWDIPFKVENN